MKILTRGYDLAISFGDNAGSLIEEAGEAYKSSKIYAVKGTHDIIAPYPSPAEDVHLRVVTIVNKSY